MLDADILDVLEHRRAALAHQLHIAAKTAFAERDHCFDGVGGFERNVEEDEVGNAAADGLAHVRAVGKLHRVDAGAVQHQ